MNDVRFPECVPAGLLFESTIGTGQPVLALPDMLCPGPDQVRLDKPGVRRRLGTAVESTQGPKPSQKCGKPPAWSKCFCAARDERKARTLTEAVIPAGLALLAAGGLFIEVRDATLIGPALPRIAE